MMNFSATAELGDFLKVNGGEEFFLNENENKECSETGLNCHRISSLKSVTSTTRTLWVSFQQLTLKAL